MKRAHRSAHRLLWPLLTIAVGLSLVLALLLRPAPAPALELPLRAETRVS